MKKIHLYIYMMLAAMSITSCTHRVAEKPDHEVETLAELFDSLGHTDVPADLFMEMKQLFETADLVKFAKAFASDHEDIGDKAGFVNDGKNAIDAYGFGCTPCGGC